MIKSQASLRDVLDLGHHGVQLLYLVLLLFDGR
jgi:hypothetical protein